MSHKLLKRTLLGLALLGLAIELALVFLPHTFVWPAYSQPIVEEQAGPNNPPPTLNVGDCVWFTTRINQEYWHEGRVIEVNQNKFVVDDGLWQFTIIHPHDTIRKIDSLSPRKITEYDRTRLDIYHGHDKQPDTT